MDRHKHINVGGLLGFPANDSYIHIHQHSLLIKALTWLWIHLQHKEVMIIMSEAGLPLKYNTKFHKGDTFITLWNNIILYTI